ncbi:MAG: SigB/SigF/SigG family RNA polymerase sigma factor [Actinomycetota bacterium]|nr:SigB/SigF/SigG family RNA polymerase sigma factor [Actinomycetota bacterium]
MSEVSATGQTSDRWPADDRWLDGALAEFATTRDPSLREEIVHRSMWLATRGARRFATRGEPFDDLLQVARLGLLKAIDRYDPSQGVQFGAYATPTIIGELRRHFRDYTWSVHVPRRAKDMRASVNEQAEQLTKDLGRSPTVPEIADRLNVSADLVLESLEANNAYRSFSLEPEGAGQQPVAGDDPNLGGVLDREQVVQLLTRLRPRERAILYMRFYEELSQSEIAERIGTSQVHVGRLLAASLSALREVLGAEQLEPSDS